MRNLIIISLCTVILTLASCSKENVLVEKPIPGTGETTLSATFARGGEGAVTDAELKIDGVRMVVFSSPRPGQGGGQVVRNTYKPGATPTFNEIVPVGYIDIYLIANELGASAGAENWNLEDVTNIEELESKIAKYTNHPVVSDSRPIPMCARYQNVKIDLNGTMTQNGTSLSLNNVKLKRIIAKTTLTLGCVFANLPDGGQFLTLESVQIKRMPKFSHLAPDHNYSGVADEDLINGTPASISEVVYQYGNPLAPTKKTGFTAKFSCYLPEYLPSDASKYTYFDIVASPDGNPSVKLRYKLIIGDGIDDGHGNRKDNAQMAASSKSSDFNVSRNTHYIFNTQIKSYGTVDGMIVDPTVEPWGDPKEVDEDLKGHVLNVSDIQVSITDISSARIYFWSNQKDVAVDDLGYTGATTFTVNSFFDKLAGVGTEATNFHYTYNPTTQSGTGYMDIRLIGNTAGNYVHRILLNANGLKRQITINTSIVRLEQIDNINTKNFAYVGTFHRHNEVGERLIRIINVTSGSITTGTWTATVIKGEEWIRLDKNVPATQPNNNDAESAPPVTGTKPVTGICDESTDIAFRVGLSSVIAPDANRYGLIMLTYNNNSKGHMIYVRQGEAADYVMRPGDLNGNGEIVPDNRACARKFSPYNLTAPTDFESGPVQVAVRGGVFTPYPTWPGAFWVWHGDRYAHEPHQALHKLVRVDVGSFWDDLKDAIETCPEGYRRPNDGVTKAFNTEGPIEGSELRQSLFLNPHTSTVQRQKANSCTGYYADGYFDRYDIQTSPTGALRTTVMANSHKIALVGNLMYNPTTHASLFFPLSGDRNGSVGEIYAIGERASYWSSTTYRLYSTNWFLYLKSSPPNLSNNYGAFGFSTRCVQE